MNTIIRVAAVGCLIAAVTGCAGTNNNKLSCGPFYKLAVNINGKRAATDICVDGDGAVTWRLSSRKLPAPKPAAKPKAEPKQEK